MAGKSFPAAEEPDLFRFAQQQRQTDCPVCGLDLSDKVQEQLKAASRKKIGIPTQVQFLKEKYGYGGDEEMLIAHKNAHHDRRLRELSS